MKKKTTSKSKRSSWHIVAEGDDIHVYNESKFYIASKKFSEVEDYLAKWVSPNDTILFVGFKKEVAKVKGSKFLKEQNA